MKRGSHMFTLGQKVKGQPSCDFLVALIFWQDTWTHHHQCVFLLCTQMQDDDRKTPRFFVGQTGIVNKVGECRCPKALDDFADFRIFCQVGRFISAGCYQFLMIFHCFGIFSLQRNGFFIFIIPGSRGIVQVVQIVQIGQPKFHFTEPGSNLAFVLKRIVHKFYKIQNGARHFVDCHFVDATLRRKKIVDTTFRRNDTWSTVFT